MARIGSAFREAGVAVDVMETGENRTAGPKAKRAIAQGYDAIVVCGGDGTIFDVIQGMAGSSVGLGIIPFGTGNVMAQNLKVPKDPVAAVHWILRSRPLPVPLGRITCCAPDGQQSWLFAMAAGMGVHAALMSEARRSGKDVTGRAAYFVAGGRLLLNHPVQPFDIAITTTSGAVLQQQVCEALAVRVAELNRWRTGGRSGLPFPAVSRGRRQFPLELGASQLPSSSWYRRSPRSCPRNRRGDLPRCGPCGLPPHSQPQIPPRNRSASRWGSAWGLLRSHRNGRPEHLPLIISEPITACHSGCG